MKSLQHNPRGAPHVLRAPVWTPLFFPSVTGGQAGRVFFTWKGWRAPGTQGSGCGEAVLAAGVLWVTVSSGTSWDHGHVPGDWCCPVALVFGCF